MNSSGEDSYSLHLDHSDDLITVIRPDFISLNPDKRHFDTFDSDIFATPSGPAYQSGQNEDLVSDVQYILQTLTGIEDRLAKVEDSISRQGKDI